MGGTGWTGEIFSALIWYNEINMTENMGELCRRWKRGFEAADAAIRAEKFQTLAGLSAAESCRIYDGLCGLYYARKKSSAIASPEDPAGLAQVLLRRRFNVIAGRHS